MNALIVCHAGAGLGLGHLTRAIVAARALKEERRANVRLLVQGDPVQRTGLAELEHRFLDRTGDLLGAIDEQARDLDAHVVILDLHPGLVPPEVGGFLQTLRQRGIKVISVDGLRDQRGSLDLLFVPSFRSSSTGSSNGAPILFGWDCFLLDVRYPPVPWRPGRRVLALTGGSDMTGLGDVLPELLDETLPAGTELHWVTGPYARQPILPVSPRLSIENHQSPSDLNELLVRSNYALTVFGVSLFESLYYGIPTVVFSPYGRKDDDELETIANEGVALTAQDERDAVIKLKELMADTALATALSRRARQKMSTTGGSRLAQAAAQLLA
jgi:hypothetical protein